MEKFFKHHFDIIIVALVSLVFMIICLLNHDNSAAILFSNAMWANIIIMHIYNKS